MKKTTLDYNTVEGLCLEIARQIQQDRWLPNYVVGITRGGSIPAVLISQYLGVPCEMLKVSLRDGGETESNCWMSEDAFGYNMNSPKNILIVDDINDSGATLKWIQNDWQASCRPNHPAWNEIWGNTVRVACLVDNQTSQFKISYAGTTFSRLEEDAWFVFPWEDWWKNGRNA